jgi:2-phospho-L-lactate guanylyltransferase (CobY/MobA/RfbA family)
MSKVDAVILAGAPANELAETVSRCATSPATQDDGANRAMIHVAGKSMLQWVVDALRGASSVGRIAAVGSVSADGLDLVVEPGGNLVENIRRGIEALNADGPVLVVCSDIPLLTPEAVEDFLERAEKLEVDLAYPILPRAHCEARYPGIKRTYLRTGDGVFTGGNIMLIRPEFVSRNWEAIAGAYAARKHVLKLARMIGIGVLIRVLAARVFSGLLRISMLERAAGRMLDARVAAVVSAYPEIGEDVDKPSDLKAVQRFLVSNKRYSERSEESRGRKADSSLRSE